jgi:hypothetical protein
MTNLGSDGQQAIKDWVAGGGHFVGWQGGAQLAGNDGLGISMVRSRASTRRAPHLHDYDSPQIFDS